MSELCTIHNASCNGQSNLERLLSLEARANVAAGEFVAILKQIQADCLWAETHATWEIYLEDRWGLPIRQYQRLAAAKPENVKLGGSGKLRVLDVTSTSTRPKLPKPPEQAHLPDVATMITLLKAIPEKEARKYIMDIGKAFGWVR